MAKEKPRAEKEEPTEQQTPFSHRNRNLLTVAVVGGLMLLEGVGIFAAVSYLGGDPAIVQGGEGLGSGGEGGDADEPTELHVTDLVSFNNREGRVYVYQISVYVDVEARSSAKIKHMLEARKNAINDRLSKTVRASDPKYLEEPGLETLRRQFKSELDRILGSDELIKTILFPEFNVSRAD